MVNTAVVILYKNCLFDIYRNISNFASRSAQQSYYAGLTKLKYNAVFNKIGDPILLDVDLETVLGYDRGEIQYNGVSYYFQVSDLRVNAQGTTEISYIIDVWETMRYQYDLKLGSGQITRLGNPTDSELASYCRGLSYIPSYKQVEYYGHTRPANAPSIYCIIRDNDADECYITRTEVQINDIGRINTFGIVKWALDDLKKGISKDNLTVISAYYSSVDFSATWERVTETTTWFVKDPTFAQLSTAFWAQIPVTTPIMSDVFTEYFISDDRGNQIYTLPVFREVSPICDIFLNISGSSGSIDGFISDGPQKSDYSNEYMVTIPMEPVDIYNDTWATYQAQQRQADIDSRNQQMNSQLIGSLANIGTGAVTGAALGSVVPGIGTAVGAVGGAVVSAVASLTGYASSAYNAPKEQAIQDNIHKKASDTLNLVGTGVNGSAYCVYSGTPRAGWAKKTVTDEDRTYMQAEINTYGYIMDYPSGDVDSLIRSGAFQANVEVLGCPSSWAAQVQNRIANGVYFQ